MFASSLYQANSNGLVRVKTQFSTGPHQFLFTPRHSVYDIKDVILSLSLFGPDYKPILLGVMVTGAPHCEPL